MSAASAPSRIVLRAPNWLGDAVLALPAMAAVRRAYPRAELTVAAAASLAALYREGTDVRPDHVIELADKQREAIKALAAGAFDLGILFPNSFRSAWQLRRARVPARWGYATSGRGVLLTRKSRPEKVSGPRHHADYFRALVRGLDVACDDAPPRIAVTAASAERAAALLAPKRGAVDGPIVGFAPGAAYGQAKQWPPDRVAAVIARLASEHRATSVIVGAAHDRDAERAIESWLRAHAPDALARVVDLVGRTSLGVLAGVAARCAVFVTNDSGAMHVAAAVGRPVVALFGPTDERATHPLGVHEVLTEAVFCRPCHLRDCPIDHRCMKRISADRVIETVTRYLSKAGG
ncbi:MAG TPA: lipopolysaccharide heptosyltransferase II [Vicinamibacterales bacterium]|nr:lipopolysaccharide heptosyltransferase II [Vicinamibacterales bacterium]